MVDSMVGNNKIAYKVVSAENVGILTSWVFTDPEDRRRVIYTPGEWAVGTFQDSWLFVFDSLETMLLNYGPQFDGHLGHEFKQYWSCEVEDLVPLVSPPPFGPSEILDYWAWVRDTQGGIPCIKPGSWNSDIKPGCCVAPRVKLLERIVL